MANIEKKDAVKKPAKAPSKKRRLNPIKFFREVIAELKKVSWPTKKDLISYSVAVLLFVAIAAIIVGLLDMGFSAGIKALVGINL